MTGVDNSVDVQCDTEFISRPSVDQKKTQQRFNAVETAQRNTTHGAFKFANKLFQKGACRHQNCKKTFPKEASFFLE